MLSNLGFSNFNGLNPFGDIYYDVFGNQIYERSVNDFEKVLMGDPNQYRTIKGWLMRGAIREDDGGYAAFGRVYRLGKPNEPYDDPYENFNRFCNHFFNPLNGSALTSTCPGDTPQTAPNWALGTGAAFAAPVPENTSRRNHFSVFDAREAMYRALTGKTKSGSDADPNNSPATESIRKTWWATTFRALGDIVHLNQDMAQPQHTRNESHGLTARYEKYIDARAKGDKSYTMDGTPISPAPLVYDGYAIPAFTRYSDYWSSGIGDQTSYNGKGLADYSNHGFFTLGNNIGDNTFTRPDPKASSYTTQSANYPNPSSPYIADYLMGTVTDNNTGVTSDSIKMSRPSAWNAFLPWSFYSLDNNNYDDMAKLLIPRAVSYSAGLINYFFRDLTSGSQA